MKALFSFYLVSLLCMVVMGCSALQNPLEPSKSTEPTDRASSVSLAFPYLEVIGVRWANDTTAIIRSELPRYDNSSCISNIQGRFVASGYLILKNGSVTGIDRRNQQSVHSTAASLTDFYHKSGSYKSVIIEEAFALSDSKKITDIQYLILLTDGFLKTGKEDISSLRIHGLQSD